MAATPNAVFPHKSDTKSELANLASTARGSAREEIRSR